MATRTQIPPPVIKPKLLRWFRHYGRGYIRKHFDALRLAPPPFAPDTLDTAIIAVNHPSWWDPLVCMTLAEHLFPQHRHYAPIDAAALEQYRFFRHLGFFGVARDTRAGAAEFLQRSTAILTQPKSLLWITVQGHFADPRLRPLTLAPGIGHLAAALPTVPVLPLALEYPYWQQRAPEALAAFGPPLTPPPGQRATACTTQITTALTATMDQLAQLAQAQDPDAFTTVLDGQARVNWFYDLWRRGRALLTGQQFTPRHGPRV